MKSLASFHLRDDVSFQSWIVRKSGKKKKKITLESTLSALKMGSYSALKKREALINIGMIYLESVSNLEKD